MNPARWREIASLLDAMLESEPSSWPAILDERCAADTDLRREVEALLQHYQSAQGFLASPPAATAAALIAEAQAAGAVAAGGRIGSYRLVRQIGQGGSARVFLAERDDGQFQHRVALKLLRPGRDSEIDQGRFRAERQILATLSHPHIARLLDGGVTDAGLPYLVMELVEGDPIDRFAAARQLSTRQRLELFATVADAVQYAHRNLVIHRDLKPSNVLVTADGQVKLLDFGLAKLLESPRAADTAPSWTTQRWMTPEYAAPEQVRTEPATTLTDVYQLGAVLYEMLTGQLPFGTRQQSPFALERAVLEQEPDQPSRTVPELRGDLDAIVLKALRKEPDRRYDSAQAFADDVRRHLSGHPVLARRQTWAYRARRFVRRHRWAVTAAAAGVLLIGTYAVTVTVQRSRVTAALAQASTEAQKATQVTDLMLGLFEQSEGGRAFSDTVTARALLSRGAARARQLTAQPVVQAEMLDVIGQIYAQLGDFEQARGVFEEALAIRRSVQGGDHLDVARTLNDLAEAVRQRGDRPGAAALHREALTIRRSALGDTHPATLESLYWLGSALHEIGQTPEGRVMHDEWLAAVLAQRPETTEARATQLINAAMILRYRGERERLEDLHREAVAIRRQVFGPQHPYVAGALRTLGTSLRLLGKLAESEAALREAVAIQRAAYPDGHPETAEAVRALALTLSASQRLDEALALYLEAEALHRRYHGADNVMTLNVRELVGDIYREMGRLDLAERYLRDVVRVFERDMGDRNLLTMRARVKLGATLRARGALAEAEPLLLRGYAAYQEGRMPGGSAIDIQRLALESLVQLYEAQGREREARQYRVLLDSGLSAAESPSRR